MTDRSQSTDHDVGTNLNTQSCNVLLKRNPHLQSSQLSSPAGFGGLGTRQFLQKQLMTPGSATSASSFEEGASYDGFSDAGTPGTDDGRMSSLDVNAQVGTKQPTKRLSSLSRESLARRLMGPSTDLPDPESVSKVDRMEEDLPPSELLSRLVVKRVPDVSVGEASAATAMVPLSPRSTKVTHRIVASPTRKTMRRVVVRTTGEDGQVHEEVQYVDADGQVVQTKGSFFNAEGDTSTTAAGATVTRRVSTPVKTVRRLVVRRPGADGQVHEEVQFVDANGNVVEGEGTRTSSTSFTTSTTSTPTQSTVTRRIVTPAKLTKRTLRRTRADGKVHEEVQYLDAEGTVVKTEGGDSTSTKSLSSSNSGAVVPRTTVTPGKSIRRVVVRRTGADGQVHEEVQYMDADGNVVQSDGSALVKTSSFSSVTSSNAPLSSTSGRTLVTRRVVSPGRTLKRVIIRRKGADGQVREEVQYVDADGNVVSTDGDELSKSGSFTTEETITHEGSSDTPGRHKVTRRIIRRMLVRKDGTRVPVEQYVDSDGQVIETEAGTLVRSDSFSSVASDTSSSSRRTITRRVVSSPGKVVRRTVVHKASPSSGAESEDEVQYLDTVGGELVSSGSFTRTTTSRSTPGRKIITRRVVTPQRVVRRMVVHKGTAGSGAEADVDDLDIDAELVQSEGSISSDESVGGSSRGGVSVSDRIIIPRSGTRRVVSRSVTASNQPQEEMVTESTTPPMKKVVTSVNPSNQSEVTTPTRVGIASVSELQEGSTSPETTQKIGLTPGVIWDYFTKSEDEEKPPANPVEALRDISISKDESKVPVLASGMVTSKTEAVEYPATKVVDDEVKEPKLGRSTMETSVTGAATKKSTVCDDSTSPNQEAEVTAREEGVITVSSVEEPIVRTSKLPDTTEKDETKPQAPAGAFWNFFGKSDDNQVNEEPSKTEPMEDQADNHNASLDVSSSAGPDQVVDEDQSASDEDDDEFETPQAALDIGEVREVGEDKTPGLRVAETIETSSAPSTNEIDMVPTNSIVSPGKSSYGDTLLPAVAGITGASILTAAAVETITTHQREPAEDHPGDAEGEISVPDTSAIPTEAVAPDAFDELEKPRHTRRSSGGVWGFFGKSEEEPKENTSEHNDREEEASPVECVATSSPVENAVDCINETKPQLPVDEDDDVSETGKSAALVLPTTEEGVATASFVEESVTFDKDVSLVAGASEEEVVDSLRNTKIPAVVGENASVDRAVVLVHNAHIMQPAESASDVLDRKDAVVPTATMEMTSSVTSTTKTEEEARGGFWGFFGKSEANKPTTTDVAPETQEVEATLGPQVDEIVEYAEDTLPSSVTSTVHAPSSPSSVTSHSINALQQDETKPEEGDVEIPDSNEVAVSSAVDEDKTPVPIAEELQGEVVDVPEHREKPKATPKSSCESGNDDFHSVAAIGASGAIAAVAASTLGEKKGDALSTDQALKPDTAELHANDEAVTSRTGVSPNASGLAVPAIQTSTTTATAQEETESPSNVSHRKPGRSIWKFWGADKPKSPLTEQNKEDEDNDATAVAVATANVAGAEHQEVGQSGQSPGPSAGDGRQYWHQQGKQNPTQISYAAADGATYGPESRFESMTATEKSRSPVARSQGAAFESPRDKKHPAVENAYGVVVTEVTQTTVTVEEDLATVADIAVVTDSQQSVERESAERDQVKDDKPARAGGFWSFLGKKEKSEELAVVSTAASAFEVESTTNEDKAAVSAVIQVETIRRSIPSNGTPTNANSVAAPAGKLVRDSERRTTELIDGVEPDNELEEPYVEIASPRHGEQVLNEEGQWTVKPCSLAWNNLRLTRKSWKNAPATTSPSGSNEVVLNGVSGSLKAREFLVITGPSKDESLALLSCLAGFEDAMEGNVTVNGREWNEKMNRYIAYVMREDLFYETLTVHEHLVIQAQLRMRRTHTDEMCLARVERVIEDMGLLACRDKLIGGGISLRGISRGERKLLAIATTLLTNPSILLVEESTDGLDTFSAEKIVAKLRWLAFEKGLTVAVTLHHPSSHFYGLFDVLYLVADASCVYDGKASDCVAYFSTIGYQCPEYMSPMDYFMLQMVTGDHDSDNEGVARVDMLKREWVECNAAVYADNAARAAAASEDAVVDDYDQKNGYYHMGCCGQLWLLWARHVRRLSRYGFVFWWHFVAALLIGVVFGLVYLQLDLDDQQGIQNFSGSFFYVIVVQMLFIAYRSFVFMPKETAIALRERQEYRGGWYHLLCWYFTKIVAELPALIILSIALFVPVFLLVGIGHGFKVYLYMQFVIVLAGWAAIGLAFLMLGVLRHVTLALIVYAVLLVLFVAFGGLLINVTDIPDWLVWLHYISPVKYGYEALMKIFWKRVDSIDCDWTLEGCVALTGDGVLKFYSMENRSALGDSLILFAISFAFFFVAFWFLLGLANKRISGLQWRYEWNFKGPLGRRQQRVGNATVSDKHAATRSSMQRIVERKSQHSTSAAAERSTADIDNCYIRVETPRIGGHGLCDAPGITLGWSALWLKAPMDNKVKIDGETQRQQHLLSDASGNAKCGEMVLITGPSDESNVALLESLGGLQKKVRGKVTLNGVASSAQKVAEHSAYVSRDDLFYETLTVEEHLRFQAQLVVGKSSSGFCCGAGVGDLEVERVEMVLDELELTSKRHMLIRYLSASDAKLLSIATGLLANPSILLVEEPTCGMDFYRSHYVVLKLRQLARRGRTVVVTMTHPSSHLYALFDTLYLLAGGAAVYHGKVREAVPYFASLGYQCPQYMSPVDYFIRQVSMRSTDGATTDGQAKLFKEAWSTRYSELCLAGDGEDQEVQGGASGHRRRIGCCGQISLLFRRHVLRLARYRAVFGWHAFWMIVLGVVFGLIFLQLDLDDQQDIQNWAGAFFFIIVLQMLVIAYRTFVFLPREMAIAEREHRSGGYYMICWYLTKVFAELPAMLVLSVLLFVPAYLLVGIGHGFKLYFYMQLVMWLAGWSAAGMASLLLGLFRHVRVALIVYLLLLILFVVFGGLLVNVDDIPDYLIWLHYISPVKYGYEALMKLFWGRIAFLACGESDGSGSGSATFATVGDNYSVSVSGSGSYEDDDCIAHSGDEVLSHYSMQKSRDARSDSIILLELTVLCIFIGYAFLSLRWRRYKSRQQRYTSQNSLDN